MPVDVFNLAMDVAAGVCPGSDEGGGATRGVGDAVGVESDVESPVGPDGVQRFGGIPGRNWEEWSSWLHAVGVSHVERATINQLAFTGSWGATGCDNTTLEVRALATLTRFRFATVGLASGGMDFPRVRIYVGDPLTAGEQQLLFRLVKDVVDVVFASAPVAGREVVGGLVRKAFIRVVWSWLLELGSRELAAVVW